MFQQLQMNVGKMKFQSGGRGKTSSWMFLISSEFDHKAETLVVWKSIILSWAVKERYPYPSQVLWRRSSHLMTALIRVPVPRVIALQVDDRVNF